MNRDIINKARNLYKKIKSLFIKDKYDTSGMVDYILNDYEPCKFKPMSKKKVSKMLDNLSEHKTPLQEFIDISKSLGLRHLSRVPPKFFGKDFQLNEIGDWLVVGRNINGLITFRHKNSSKVIEIHDYNLN